MKSQKRTHSNKIPSSHHSTNRMIATYPAATAVASLASATVHGPTEIVVFKFYTALR